MDHVKNVNCVVIGDGPAGKSALINVFHEKKLMDSVVSNYWETGVFEHFSTTLKIDNEDIRFNYLDTAGQHDYYGGDLFTMLFHGADVIMLAFGVDGFIDNVEYFWMKELNRIFANKRLPPIILVGTKIDLRGEERSADDRPLTTYLDGVKLSKRIGARRYLECSAKTDLQSCQNAFEAAVKEALKKEESTQDTSRSFPFLCFKGNFSESDDQQ